MKLERIHLTSFISKIYNSSFIPRSLKRSFHTLISIYYVNVYKKKKILFNLHRQMTEIKRNRVYLFCLCTGTYLLYQSNSFHFIHGKK